MKKLKVLGIGFACALLLSACDSSDNNVTVSSSSAAEQSEVVESTVAEPKEEKETTSEVGKRSNPVKLGETATFDTTYYNNDGDPLDANLSITLSNVIRGQEALDYLMAANEFNAAPPEGQEWVIVDVALVVNKGDADVPYYEMGIFTPISSSGEEVPQAEYPSFANGEAFGNVDLYEGANTTGKFGFLTKIDDETILEYTGADFYTSVFFSLK